jgi:hypothetical protein
LTAWGLVVGVSRGRRKVWLPPWASFHRLLLLGPGCSSSSCAWTADGERGAATDRAYRLVSAYIDLIFFHSANHLKPSVHMDASVWFMTCFAVISVSARVICVG